MQHSPPNHSDLMKPVTHAKTLAASAPRDASRKDWPGPRCPFACAHGGIPLPLNEK